VSSFVRRALDFPFVLTADGRQGMTYVGWGGTSYQAALSCRTVDG